MSPTSPLLCLVSGFLFVLCLFYTRLCSEFVFCCCLMKFPPLFICIFFHKRVLLFVPQDRSDNTRCFQYLIYACCFFLNFILSFMLCFYSCWTGVCWCVKAWVPCVRKHFVSLRWSDVLDVLASLGLRKDENCFKNLNGFRKTQSVLLKKLNILHVVARIALSVQMYILLKKY